MSARRQPHTPADQPAAVYDRSAARYVDAVGTTINSGFETAFDQTVLTQFGHDVQALGSGPVLDVGCGPGRAAAFLAAMGLDVAGVDPSEGMLACARAAHPQLSFAAGSITALDVVDHSLAGIVSWYSIIHTDPDDLPAAWDTFALALSPEGRLLLAFQAGDGDRIERPDAHDSGHHLVLYRHDPTAIAASLKSAGFTVEAVQVRPAELPHEDTPQAFVVAVSSPATVLGGRPTD